MNKSIIVVDTAAGRFCSRVDISEKSQDEISELCHEQRTNMGSRYHLMIIDPDLIPEDKA